MDSYTSHEICALAGVTYRQLDYWVRSGLLQPAIEAHGSGTRRQFDADDLRRVRRIHLASRLNSGSLVDALDVLDELETELASLADPQPAF